MSPESKPPLHRGCERWCVRSFLNATDPSKENKWALLTRLSRGRAPRESDRWRDQPAGEALWRHPAMHERVRQDAGHLTDQLQTSHRQPCCPLSLRRWLENSDHTPGWGLQRKREN